MNFSDRHSFSNVKQNPPKHHRRIHIICEGQTEEMFVNVMMQPHFDLHRIEILPKLIGTFGQRGGHVDYDRVKTDVQHILSYDFNSYVTMFIDFYGICGGFPGVARARKLRSARERHDLVVDALRHQLLEDCGTQIASRVIPYIQMHEFEGLLFSSPKDMAAGILQPNLWKRFDKIAFHFDTPEDINDNIATAPSKRILQIFRGYQKVLHGSIIARRIGLKTIRQMCPLFDEWIGKMERVK